MNVMTKSGATQAAANKNNMTGAHVLAAALQRHGVREIFSQSIPSALFLRLPTMASARSVTELRTPAQRWLMPMREFPARSLSSPVRTARRQHCSMPGLAEALKASIPVVAIVQDVA